MNPEPTIQLPAVRDVFGPVAVEALSAALAQHDETERDPETADYEVEAESLLSAVLAAATMQAALDPRPVPLIASVVRAEVVGDLVAALQRIADSAWNAGSPEAPVTAPQYAASVLAAFRRSSLNNPVTRWFPATEATA